MIIRDDIELEVVYSKEEKIVYIGTPSSSGAKYKCETIDDLKKSIDSYIESYVEYDKIPTHEDIEIDK